MTWFIPLSNHCLQSGSIEKWFIPFSNQFGGIEKHDIPSLNHPTTLCQGQQGARRLKYINQLPSAKQFGNV